MDRNDTINKSQVFYTAALPGGIHRLRNLTSVKITGARNDEESLRQLDTGQLIAIVNKYVAAWDALHNTEVSPNFIRHLADPAQYISITVPEALFAQPFPLMLQCNKCKVIDFFQGKKDDEKRIQDMLNPARTTYVYGRRRIGCKRPSCKGGYMRQVPYTAVHRCGNIQPISIPGGMRRTANVGFNDAGSSIAEGKFFDVEDKNTASYHALQDNCSICKDRFTEATGINLRASPVRANEQMFAHNVQYLSLSPDIGRVITTIEGYMGDPDTAISPEGEDLAKGILQCLMGVEGPAALVEHVESLKSSKHSGDEDVGSIRDEIHKQIDTRDMLLSGISDDETKATVAENFNDKIKRLEEKISKIEGRFSSAKLGSQDLGTLVDLARRRRSLESIFLPYDAKDSRETLEGYSQRVTGAKKDRALSSITHLQDRYHITEVSHYKSINVVMASIGFTRERKDPPEGMPGHVVPVALNGYLNTERKVPKSYIYALPAETEAIEIKLSPTKVLRWCIDDVGWKDPGPEITTADDEALKYLLLHSPALRMDPIDVMRDTKDFPAASLAPFHLLHTISHCLAGTAKRHTGYDDKSISEYLLPMNLSIMLYVSSVQNYTSGGLRMLFEHYLRQWMDDACNYAFSCAFDPVCSDKGSTCSGCVQIVLGCETFNHGLSRCYIHGGELEEETQLQLQTGFWG